MQERIWDGGRGVETYVESHSEINFRESIPTWLVWYMEHVGAKSMIYKGESYGCCVHVLKRVMSLVVQHF